MKNFINTTSIAALVVSTALLSLPVRADEQSQFEPAPNSVMFFDSASAAGYYKIDPSEFRTTVTVVPHDENVGNPMHFIDKLDVGQATNYTAGIDRRGDVSVRLNLRRVGDHVHAEVVTEIKPNLSNQAHAMSDDTILANFYIEQMSTDRGVFQQ